MKHYLITYGALGATFKTDLEAENETAVRIYFKKFYPSAKIVSINEQIMKQQFIVVTSQNKAKNQVQELCQKHLEVLDQTLYNSFTDAKFVIENKFKQSLNAYKGRAAIPELKNFKPDNETTQFYIPDVIYITVYEVKKRPN